MADSKRSKNKNSGKTKTPFIVASVLLCLAVIIPVILLVISSILGKSANDKLNESLYPLKYEELVAKAAAEYNVDIALVYGIMRTESGFDPEAVSPVGAIGLMQIMPDTFTWLQNYRTNFMPEEILDAEELYKPEVNIDYGVYLLGYLLDHYNNNVSLVICSYNAGYGNVDAWLADGTLDAENVTAEDVPFPETSNYLTKVTYAMDMYNQLYFGEDAVHKEEYESFLMEHNYEENDTDINSEYLSSDISTEDDYNYSYGEDTYTDEYAAGYTDEYNAYQDDYYQE